MFFVTAVDPWTVWGLGAITVHEVENPRITCSWPSISMDSVSRGSCSPVYFFARMSQGVNIFFFLVVNCSVVELSWFLGWRDEKFPSSIFTCGNNWILSLGDVRRGWCRKTPGAHSCSNWEPCVQGSILLCWPHTMAITKTANRDAYWRGFLETCPCFRLFWIYSYLHYHPLVLPFLTLNGLSFQTTF